MGDGYASHVGLIRVEPTLGSAPGPSAADSSLRLRLRRRAATIKKATKLTARTPATAATMGHQRKPPLSPLLLPLAAGGTASEAACVDGLPLVCAADPEHSTLAPATVPEA